MFNFILKLRPFGSFARPGTGFNPELVSVKIYNTNYNVIFNLLHTQLQELLFIHWNSSSLQQKIDIT